MKIKIFWLGLVLFSIQLEAHDGNISTQCRIETDRQTGFSKVVATVFNHSSLPMHLWGWAKISFINVDDFGNIYRFSDKKEFSLNTPIPSKTRKVVFNQILAIPGEATDCTLDFSEVEIK